MTSAKHGDGDFSTDRLDDLGVRASVPGGNGKPPSRSPEITMAAPDPFDPDSLRLPQDFGASIGVKKVHTTIPIRKPLKTEFVRVHPEYSTQTAVLEFKEQRELYLLAPALRAELANDPAFRICTLYLAVNRQAVPLIWPAWLPTQERGNSWLNSMIAAIELAKTKWVRVVANMSAGAYDTFEATGHLSEPEYPDLPFLEACKIAFRDKYIDSIDHPAIRQLRGEV